MLQFKVDAERCSQCGLCVQDCPFGAMAMEEYPVIPDENACLRCQHCLAVCPTAAISILGKDPDQKPPAQGQPSQRGKNGRAHQGTQIRTPVQK